MTDHTCIPQRHLDVDADGVKTVTTTCSICGEVIY